MTPLEEPHAVKAPEGMDIALIQAQLACLSLCFLLVLATMYRGSAFHDDGWHLVRAGAARGSTAKKKSHPLASPLNLCAYPLPARL